MQLEQLMQNWLAKKAAERKATAERIAVETQISTMIKIPNEGSETVKTKSLKMTVTQSVTRKIDERKARQIFNELPEGLCPVQWVESAKLDIVGYRWLRDFEPGMFKIFCDCITEKKGKPNFKIEEV